MADKLLGLQGLIINPMERGTIESPLDVGVKTINGLLTLGRGQRVGLMAGSGVGKSVLLGMMTKYTDADVVVIGLIGERGREVKEFVTETLRPRWARQVYRDCIPSERVTGARVTCHIARALGRRVLA